MADSIFRHGAPVMVDYTPASGNVAVGEVVVLGSVTANTSGTGAVAAVAHRAITNNTLGALAVGGGVYDMINLNNAATGAKVYWDIQNNTRKVTSVSPNNAVFGWIVAEGGGGANTNCKVKHAPYHGNA
jgi:coenzyme F420-reducing hydrogenase gamma subunit